MLASWGPPKGPLGAEKARTLRLQLLDGRRVTRMGLVADCSNEKFDEVQKLLSLITATIGLRQSRNSANRIARRENVGSLPTGMLLSSALSQGAVSEEGQRTE